MTQNKDTSDDQLSGGLVILQKWQQQQQTTAIYFRQLKQIQSEHCKQQRKATREAIRLNELVAYVKK